MSSGGGDVAGDSPPAHFLVHDAEGIHLWNTNGKRIGSLDIDDESKPTALAVSNDCRYVAVSFKTSVKLYGGKFNTDNGELPPFIREFDVKGVQNVAISPKNTFLLVLGLVSQANNLKLFRLDTGELAHQWTEKNREMIRWSPDEKIAHRMIASDILFYENNDFTRCPNKISQKKIGRYEFVTDKAGCSYVAVFTKGSQGSPSSVRIYGYPRLDNPVAAKSFFKVDSIHLKWNPRGDAILILASSDHDPTGKSYYGECVLHFMNLRGDTSTISGRKDGTVATAEWLPDNQGFLVIQGKIPSSITWYNNRAEILHTFPDAPVNGIFVNPFGSLVAFTGFGNLSGNVFIWNLRTKTLVSNFMALFTTCFLWLSDGQHFISATHHVRLKMANGFKLWNYLGTMLHKHDCRDDDSVPLFQVIPFDEPGRFQELQIGATVKGKVLCDEPSRKYVPSSFKDRAARLGLPTPPPLPAHRQPGAAMGKQQDSTITTAAAVKDPEVVREKKLKNLQKKIQQIEQLKKLLEEGKQLEKNQLEKIEKENDIIKEIEMLKLAA